MSNLSLPEVVILAIVGLTKVIFTGLRSYEKYTLIFLSSSTTSGKRLRT